jgi:hypothetical protein
MLFDNVILLQHKFPPEAIHHIAYRPAETFYKSTSLGISPNPCDLSPITDFESELIENISVSFTRNFRPGASIPMKD